MVVGDSMEDVPASFNSTTASSKKQAAGAMAMDKKSKFSEKLFRLNGMELGHVIQTIESKCPEALEDIPSPTPQVEINVDALPSPVFKELEAYLQEKVPDKKKRKLNWIYHVGCLKINR